MNEAPRPDTAGRLLAVIERRRALTRAYHDLHEELLRTIASEDLLRARREREVAEARAAEAAR